MKQQQSPVTIGALRQALAFTEMLSRECTLPDFIEERRSIVSIALVSAIEQETNQSVAIITIADTDTRSLASKMYKEPDVDQCAGDGRR